jgi:hypothetical protein
MINANIQQKLNYIRNYVVDKNGSDNNLVCDCLKEIEKYIKKLEDSMFSDE